jgi:hypothetical protein
MKFPTAVKVTNMGTHHRWALVDRQTDATYLRGRARYQEQARKDGRKAQKEWQETHK